MVDPIALTIMAVNRLGPATLRAASLGVPVTVAAPDRETAEIFRAALLQTGKTRPTDRLVTVELIEDPFGSAATAEEGSRSDE